MKRQSVGLQQPLLANFWPFPRAPFGLGGGGERWDDPGAGRKKGVKGEEHR
jgi:hypothetical protein